MDPISPGQIIMSNLNELELCSDSYPFNLPLRTKNFENESEYNKFIKACERLIRSCPEYKQWRDYITDVLQIQTCSITNENMNECSVHIHHHIPSLFSLVKSIINKHMEAEESFSSFDICVEIMEYHYSNRIGFVPLVNTIHEKFHNGYIKIPIELVKGNYQYYLDNEFRFLNDEDIRVVTERLAVKWKIFKRMIGLEIIIQDLLELLLNDYNR